LPRETIATGLLGEDFSPPSLTQNAVTRSPGFGAIVSRGNRPVDED
jgi:hypothetical protein